ncbi:Cupin domain-containing protein [Pseudomonas syringae]|uniref:cupin domain-containing protein n=1 Tax=Pseudomonas syringae TaxID=317 RepID=UPI0008970F6F|nr:cupin domain-containing protein [Pseudomonas syringae]SDX04244.1 Cupin domain-containing protein [Pseudomonas syringae]SFM16726.1 Cupin domain-containing protein [Pseudomonas syringae]
MNNHTFSSRDFVHVPASLAVEDVMGSLLHEGVRTPTLDAFSESRKHEVHVVDLPSRSISMTFGALQPLQGSGLHRHNYETIIYIISGTGFSMIGETQVAWTAGDAIYIPVWRWHKHVNTSEGAEATYIACENAPLLQALGVALREEAS